MAGGEEWCGVGHQHSSHWLRQRVRCDGVSRDEAAVMAVLVENGYAQAGNLDRDDARRVIDALDKARGA